MPKNVLFFLLFQIFLRYYENKNGTDIIDWQTNIMPLAKAIVGKKDAIKEREGMRIAQ